MRHLLLAVLVSSCVVFAQHTNGSDERSAAFNSDIIGLEGLAFDPNAPDLAAGAFDERIAKWQSVVSHLEEEVTRVSAQGDSGAVSAVLQQLNAEIALARGRVATLTALKNLVLTDDECGYGEKLQQMKALAELLKGQLAQMAPAIEATRKLPNIPQIPGFQAASVSLQASYERYESLLRTVESHLDIMETSCADAKRQSTIEENTRRADDAVARGLQIAEGGEVGDAPELRKLMVYVAGGARSDQMMGMRESGPDREEHYQQQLMSIFSTYTGKIAETCQKQSSDVEFILALERQAQGTGVEGGRSGKVDLDPCLNRMYEVNAIMDVPFQLRHCGRQLDGHWAFRLAPGSNWALKGGLEVDTGGSGNLSVSGTGKSTMGTYSIWFKGPATITIRQDKIGRLKLATLANMELQLQRSAIPAGGGVMHPARSATGTYPVQMLSGKACDPAQDVWKFDPSTTTNNRK